jgi:MFS-type transporter involved in bile tolerance (Atg22 family)
VSGIIKKPILKRIKGRKKMSTILTALGVFLAFFAFFIDDKLTGWGLIILSQIYTVGGFIITAIEKNTQHKGTNK